MTSLRLLFYGKLAERIDRNLVLDWAEEGTTIATLRMRLAELYPEARADLPAPVARACIGDEMVGDSYPIRAGDTVEFFPPVSGG